MTDDHDPETRSGGEVVADPMASGEPDALFARIDAGEVDVTGDGGLIPRQS